MGEVRLSEIRVSVVDAFLKSLRKTGVTSREDRARKALSLMFQVAVLHDALSSNPVTGLGRRSRGAREVKALDVGNVAEVRQFVRRWELEKVGRSGPKRSYTLSEMVDVMLGSGIRIGELLALRWMDVDLDSTVATITIAGTLTQPAKGPLVRKPSPKSKAGFRVLTLPDYARDVFAARLARAGEVDPEQGVFLTRNGTWVTPNNVRRDLRAARAESGFEWVTPHTFRKSVATLIDGDEGSKSAASQLGHSSDAVTKTHYIQKAAAAGDHRETLDKFAPSVETGDVEETGDSA
jgi:integrase